MNLLIQHISQNPKLPGLAIFLICIIALSIAFFVEYVVGIEPCILCLYQRIPYVAAGIFALFAIIAPAGGFTQQAALAGCAVAFMAGSGTAFYHFGVEEQWWAASCSGAQDLNMSLQDLKASIMSEPLKPCDQKDWVMLGLSITVYNTIGSLFLAIGSFTSLHIIRKLKEHSLNQ
ncbi:disulfide bond formation protein B [Terasakiella sp. SH-1]|uniref:disulfide bond formation protein B n=1 Tax=Terasakiella sp. SH-1 TaxID=2560057 RepID=UPI00142FAF6C|nr:disulfide bond formation protein B [Terasakiella sp. SH-1]